MFFKIPGTWSSGTLETWSSRNFGTWNSGNLETLELGNFGTWSSGTSETWSSRNFGTWNSGNLETLELGNFGTWSSGNLGTLVLGNSLSGVPSVGIFKIHRDSEVAYNIKSIHINILKYITDGSKRHSIWPYTQIIRVNKLLPWDIVIFINLRGIPDFIFCMRWHYQLIWQIPKASYSSQPGVLFLVQKRLWCR